MKYIYYLIALSLFSGCSSSPSLSDNGSKTCYFSDSDKRKIADNAMDAFNEALSLMSSTIDKNEKFGYLKLSKASLTKAASIGHPLALDKFCKLGADRLGPAHLRAEGKEWCKFGVDYLPAFRKALPKDYLSLIDNIEYTELTSNKCIM